MYKTVFWTLWERARLGWFGRMALKHVYYHMWNESPVQVQCMIQGAQGWYTGMTQRDGMGREVGGGFRMANTCTPVANSCQCMAKPIQYCKVKKKKKKKERKKRNRLIDWIIGHRWLMSISVPFSLLRGAITTNLYSPFWVFVLVIPVLCFSCCLMKIIFSSVKGSKLQKFQEAWSMKQENDQLWIRK